MAELAILMTTHIAHMLVYKKATHRPPDAAGDALQRTIPVLQMRLHYLLLLLPFIWQLALAPFANSVSWQPLGLPFAMVWQMAGIILTSAILLVVFTIDNRRRTGQSDCASKVEDGQ
jgi:hypothetical protein